MTCRDCAGFQFCQSWCGITEFYNPDNACNNVDERCLNFKHKDRFIELPDKVYDIRLSKTGMKVDEHNVKGIIYDCGYMAFDSKAVGKSIFLTREEAEQALKERWAVNDKL